MFPALSAAPEHVAVNTPTPFGVPPETLTAAFDATPDRISTVLQPAAGLVPSWYTALFMTPVTPTLGGVISILIVAEAVVDNPTPFLAEQVSVCPAVSFVRVVDEQPVEEA